jgi:ATP-dependent Clp protease ATP-binding subunit ClpB
VILFDEIEKAHSDVFNTLLQVLDDGRLTDAKGRTVDFHNAVLIMTSNIGSEYLLEGSSPSGEIKPDVRDLVLDDLRRRFRPEFLNRVDDIVLFKSLTRSEIEDIVGLMFEELRRRVADQGLELLVADEAVRLVAREGFDPVYGARPLRRFIAHEVETRIARALLGTDVREGAMVRVDADDGELTVSFHRPDDTSDPDDQRRSGDGAMVGSGR